MFPTGCGLPLPFCQTDLLLTSSRATARGTEGGGALRIRTDANMTWRFPRGTTPEEVIAVVKLALATNPKKQRPRPPPPKKPKR